MPRRSLARAASRGFYRGLRSSNRRSKSRSSARGGTGAKGWTSDRSAAAAARELGRATRRQQAAEARARIADEKERKRLYLESRLEETEELNQDLAETVADLQSLLATSLEIDWTVDYEMFKRVAEPDGFDSAGYDNPWPPPRIEEYTPRRAFFSKAFGGASGEAKHAERVLEGQSQFELAISEHAAKEEARQVHLANLRQQYEDYVAGLESEVRAHNAEIEDSRVRFEQGEVSAVVDHYAFVFEDDELPVGFPSTASVAYVPESKELIVEREVPTIEVVPEISAYRHIKSKDEIATTLRPLTQRKQLYSAVIAQLALRTVYTAFSADDADLVHSGVVSCFVNTIDRTTGRAVKPYVLTVRVSRESFAGIDLRQIDPVLCLRGLNARVSRDPADLQPVKPIVDFNMVDRRFVDSTDVLAELEDRPNLMELSPAEFENLITNLFQKMGFETKLTQASRDGGVDCVAWDMRPVMGGKVIVQAKRYKNVVGVSAVRDLFGTVHNEGAGKGILITTSHYGNSAHEFAANKPLELFDGTNLLYLLEEHTGVRARIEVPDDWEDPLPD